MNIRITNERPLRYLAVAGGSFLVSWAATALVATVLTWTRRNPLALLLAIVGAIVALVFEAATEEQDDG